MAGLLSGLGLAVPQEGQRRQTQEGGARSTAEGLPPSSSSHKGEGAEGAAVPPSSSHMEGAEDAADLLAQLRGMSAEMHCVQDSVSQMSSRLGGGAVHW